jgi:hypothetical protein
VVKLMGELGEEIWYWGGKEESEMGEVTSWRG